MTRSPLVLAALASSAVPGLDPVAVESVTVQAGGQFDVAFVQDSQDRRWVVRAPVSTAASAQMDLTVSLLGLLARRLPFAVPAPRGFAPLKEGGRAAVYTYLPGAPIDLASVPAGPGLAAEIGRAVAQLHNIDLGLYEEAGLPGYDPESYRARRLSDLDRAAATGSVPSGLLARWERALEELSIWRFAPTPTHGALTGRHLLAGFDDAEDAASGRVRAMTGWEHAQVADPADDFAGLVAHATPDAVDSALEAYAHARVERPDPHLRRRAQLASELAVVGGLLRSLSNDHLDLAQVYAGRLQDLQSRVSSDPDDLLTEDHPTATATATATAPTASTSASVVPDPDLHLDPDEDLDEDLNLDSDSDSDSDSDLDAETGTPTPPAARPSSSAEVTEVVHLPGHRAAGEQGHQAAGEQGHQAAGEQGHQAAGEQDDDLDEEAGYELEPGASADTTVLDTRAAAEPQRRARAAGDPARRGVEPTELIDLSKRPPPPPR